MCTLVKNFLFLTLSLCVCVCVCVSLTLSVETSWLSLPSVTESKARTYQMQFQLNCCPVFPQSADTRKQKGPHSHSIRLDHFVNDGSIASPNATVLWFQCGGLKILTSLLPSTASGFTERHPCERHLPSFFTVADRRVFLFGLN